jgi:putative flippase GtrA
LRAVLIVVLLRALHALTVPLTSAVDARGETCAHRTLWQRVTRCMSVSVVTTVISLGTLTIATAGIGMAAWIANIVATAVATAPGYHLNRRWTWGRRDASDPWREVAPFWTLSFIGLALSTVLVGVADAWASGIHLPGVLHTMSLWCAQLSGFGLLWIVQFVLLDRVVFARSDA